MRNVVQGNRKHQGQETDTYRHDNKRKAYENDGCENRRHGDVTQNHVCNELVFENKNGTKKETQEIVDLRKGQEPDKEDNTTWTKALAEEMRVIAL